MEQFLGCIGMIVVAVGGIFASAIARGFALSVIWSWFVAPVFKTDNITIVQAIGLSIIFGMLTNSGDNKSKDNNLKNKSDMYKFVHAVFMGIMVPLMTLGLAWLVYQFK